MAKIGIDIRPIGKKRTGDEAYFFGLVKSLAEIDKKNEYFLYTDRDPNADRDLGNEIKKMRLTENFKVIFINSPNRFFWNFWALPAYLKKNPIDVFHTQYIAPFWLPNKVKLVLTIHDISFNFFPEYIKKTDLFFLKKLIPQSIRRADKIITVSENEKKNIIDFYKIAPEKVDFTYNGVDFERFNHKISPKETGRINTRYKIPASPARLDPAERADGSDTRCILYIGTLQPRKNIPVLIEALNTYLNTYLNKYPENDIKLVLAGNRDARNFDRRIDETIKKYSLEDKVIFPGWIDEEDKPALLQQAACFVFPSLYEGFGIPVIEAMAAGTPVICSNIPALREIGDGAAIFCDPKNSQAFTKNISKIMTDEELRRDLTEKGKNTAQKFTWQKTAEKTQKIYSSLS